MNSGFSLLEIETRKRGYTFLEEVVWKLGYSPDANVPSCELAQFFFLKPISELRSEIIDEKLLLALAEVETFEFSDEKLGAEIRTKSSNLLSEIMGMPISGVQKAVLEVCANLLAGERQSIAEVKDFFHQLV